MRERLRIATSIGVCLLFGAILGAAIFAAFGEGPARWLTTSPRSDWLGFVGAVLSGVMTLAGAALAWFAVERQIKQAKQAIWRKERDAARLL